MFLLECRLSSKAIVSNPIKASCNNNNDTQCRIEFFKHCMASSPAID